jgi:hypothetical protein
MVDVAQLVPSELPAAASSSASLVMTEKIEPFDATRTQLETDGNVRAVQLRPSALYLELDVPEATARNPLELVAIPLHDAESTMLPDVQVTPSSVLTPVTDVPLATATTRVPFDETPVHE